MFNVFRIEMLRHIKVALGVALFHFAVLYYLYTLGVSVLHSMQALGWLILGMGLGAGVGVFQMTRYSRDNDWIHLLHRPVSVRHIFLALTLAGCLLCLITAVLPLTLYLALMDGNRMFGVEGRHYQAIPYAMCAAIAAYGCGCFAVLSASRLGFLALGMLAVFLVVAPGSDWLFSPMITVIWSLSLAYISFKPDRSLPPARVPTLLITELPIWSGCLLLITLSTAWISSIDTFLYGFNRMTRPQPGTDDFVHAMPEKEFLQFALERSTHADARLLSQQVLLGETSTAGAVSFNSYPERGQLTFIDEALILTDGSARATWRFRHDVMLFEGRELDTARFLGWLAPDGFHTTGTLPELRFDSVPWMTADQYIISDDDIYQIGWQTRQLHHRYHSDDADRFNNSLKIGETTSTLFSDSKLYLFDSAELRDADSPLLPRAVLTVPDSTSPDLRRLVILPLRDAYLVGALLGQTPYSHSPPFASLGHAHLELYRVRGTTHELISSAALPSGANEWTLYRDLVLAPGIRLFNDFVAGVRTGASAEHTLPLWYVQFPRWVYVAAVLVCLSSASLTAWLLRRSTLPVPLKVFWIIGSGFAGLAALLSFFAGYYWKRADLLLTTPTSHPSSVTTTAAAKLGYNN